MGQQEGGGGAGRRKERVVKTDLFLVASRKTHALRGVEERHTIVRGHDLPADHGAYCRKTKNKKQGPNHQTSAEAYSYDTFKRHTPL